MLDRLRNLIPGGDKLPETPTVDTRDYSKGGATRYERGSPEARVLHALMLEP